MRRPTRQWRNASLLTNFTSDCGQTRVPERRIETGAGSTPTVAKFRSADNLPVPEAPPQMPAWISTREIYTLAFAYSCPRPTDADVETWCGYFPTAADDIRECARFMRLDVAQNSGARTRRRLSRTSGVQELRCGGVPCICGWNPHSGAPRKNEVLGKRQFDRRFLLGDSACSSAIRGRHTEVLHDSAKRTNRSLPLSYQSYSRRDIEKSVLARNGLCP